MNTALEAAARELRVAEDEPLRLAFAAACIARVRHLMEAPRALELADALREAAATRRSFLDLAPLAQEAAQLARTHPGSRSLDGGGHSAVSATHALAKALAGDALAAADYAAYAAVYAYGGYAVNDRAAFEPEFDWQVQTLRDLKPRQPVSGS